MIKKITISKENGPLKIIFRFMDLKSLLFHVTLTCRDFHDTVEFLLTNRLISFNMKKHFYSIFGNENLKGYGCEKLFIKLLKFGYFGVLTSRSPFPMFLRASIIRKVYRRGIENYRKCNRASVLDFVKIRGFYDALEVLIEKYGIKINVNRFLGEGTRFSRCEFKIKSVFEYGKDKRKLMKMLRYVFENCEGIRLKKEWFKCLNSMVGGFEKNGVIDENDEGLKLIELVMKKKNLYKDQFFEGFMTAGNRYPEVFLKLKEYCPFKIDSYVKYFNGYYSINWKVTKIALLSSKRKSGFSDRLIDYCMRYWFKQFLQFVVENDLEKDSVLTIYKPRFLVLEAALNNNVEDLIKRLELYRPKDDIHCEQTFPFDKLSFECAKLVYQKIRMIELRTLEDLLDKKKFSTIELFNISPFAMKMNKRRIFEACMKSGHSKLAFKILDFVKVKAMSKFYEHSTNLLKLALKFGRFETVQTLIGKMGDILPNCMILQLLDFDELSTSYACKNRILPEQMDNFVSLLLKKIEKFHDDKLRYPYGDRDLVSIFFEKSLRNGYVMAARELLEKDGASDINFKSSYINFKANFVKLFKDEKNYFLHCERCEKKIDVIDKNSGHDILWIETNKNNKPIFPLIEDEKDTKQEKMILDNELEELMKELKEESGDYDLDELMKELGEESGAVTGKDYPTSRASLGLVDEVMDRMPEDRRRQFVFCRDCKVVIEKYR